MNDMDPEIISEFLAEADELLSRLETELVELEKDTSTELLSSAFRSLHTIKGSASFLELQHVQRLAHAAEELLAGMRDDQVTASADCITALLATIDALRRMLEHVPADGTDGTDPHDALVQNLRSLATQDATAPVPALSDAPAGDAPASDVPAGDAPAGDVLPATATGPSREETAAAKPGERETIRVDVASLDKLMAAVGELVLTRNQLRAVIDPGDHAAQASVQRLSALTRELQDTVTTTRLQPIATLFNKFPRVVRDLASALGKRVELVVDGAETELDRAVIEAVKDPLTHLLRNSIDHGIELPEVRRAAGKPESGTIRLTARHENGHVRIDIADDGRGLDLAAIRNVAVERGLIAATTALTDSEAANLIFLPGFSTRASATSVSGRGVGMDVVKTSIERVGGTVRVARASGGGTLVTAAIPLTLAIVPSVVVTSAGLRYVLAQTVVDELGRVADHTIEYVAGTPVIRLRDQLLPVVSLRSVLKHTASDAERALVIIRDGRVHFALVVDTIPGTEEVVAKPQDPLLSGIRLYSGSTIMGDGTVALILDTTALAVCAGLDASEHAPNARLAQPVTARVSGSHIGVVVVRNAGRLSAITLEQVARLEEFSASRVERATSGPVVRYRNTLLPLVELSPGSLSNGPSVQVVVVKSDTTTTGLLGVAVDEVVDIVQVEPLTPAFPMTGVSEVLYNDHVTALLDVHGMGGDA